MNHLVHPPAQACMEAWLNCENLLIGMAGKKIRLGRSTRQVIDECAQICMGTFHALRKEMKQVGALALLCVGICEECAELCDRFDDPLFRNCAAACRQCSASVTALAGTAI